MCPCNSLYYGMLEMHVVFLLWLLLPTSPTVDTVGLLCACKMFGCELCCVLLLLFVIVLSVTVWADRVALIS